MEKYLIELDNRFWEYQESYYPDIDKYFDKPRTLRRRPPVFLTKQAHHNVLTNPNANQEENKKLINLIQNRERHKWFRSMKSSQALAQSVFGNLAANDLMDCLVDLKDDEGTSLFGPAKLAASNFSMEHLGEPRHTSLDGYFSGDYQVAIECKFTEAEVGSCSRPRLLPSASNYESEFCDGTYTKQKTRRERCALTETGVLYWRYVPELFTWGDDIDLRPCPLNNNYQLIRNVLAIGITPGGKLSRNGHAVLIYDERNPAFQDGGEGLGAYRELRSALKIPSMLRTSSWQRVLKGLRDQGVLPWLTENVGLKYGL